MKPVLRLYFSILLIAASASSLPISKPAYAQTAQSSPVAQTLSFNLRDADLRTVIDMMGRANGMTFIIDPRVRGKATVISSQQMSLDTAYSVFLNILDVNGFAAIEQDDGSFRIVPSQLAATSGSSDNSANNSFVTRVVTLPYIEPQEAATLLSPLMAPGAVMTTHAASRSLIISDREENVARLSRIIDQINTSSVQDITILPLTHATSATIADTLNALEFILPHQKISHNDRANAVIVKGDKKFTAKIEKLVANLDKPQSEISNFKVVTLKFGDAEQMADVISKLVENVAGTAEGSIKRSVIADKKTNSLLVTAPPDVMQMIDAAITSLDVRPVQVLIEAIVFEVGADKLRNAGVQWGAIDADSFFGTTQIANAANNTSLTELMTDLSNNQLPSIAGTALGVASRNADGTVDAIGVLNLLSSDTATNILSTPSILTLNNQEAEITVAQSVPFVTGSYSSVGSSTVPNQPFQTIQRQDVGLKLKVLPQLTADGMVRMKIEQEVSNLTATSSSAGSEITNKREIKTNVIVGDGDLVLLGGLTLDESSETVEKIPVLGSIPIIGALFRNKTGKGDKRVLLLLLRPTILATQEDATVISRQIYDKAAKDNPEMDQKLNDYLSSTGLPPDGTHKPPSDKDQ